MTTREGAKEAPLLLLRAQARTLYLRSCARRCSIARAGEGALPLGPPSNFLFPPTRFPEAVALDASRETTAADLDLGGLALPHLDLTDLIVSL